MSILVPVARQRCLVTGKVTVGLASHWPCVTDFSGHLRAQGLSKGDEHLTNTPHGVWYYLLFYAAGHQPMAAITRPENFVKFGRVIFEIR